MTTPKKEYRIPKALSQGEEEFAAHCAIYGLQPEREFRFMPKRRFRFDFAFPAKRVAVEIEGGSWSGGRHVRPQGYANDLEKYNLAALYNWRVFRFTPEMVHRGEAIDMMTKCVLTGMEVLK